MKVRLKKLTKKKLVRLAAVFAPKTKVVMGPYAGFNGTEVYEVYESDRSELEMNSHQHTRAGFALLLNQNKAPALHIENQRHETGLSAKLVLRFLRPHGSQQICDEGQI